MSDLDQARLIKSHAEKVCRHTCPLELNYGAVVVVLDYLEMVKTLKHETEARNAQRPDPSTAKRGDHA